MGKAPDVNFPEPLDPQASIAQQQQGNVESAIASTLLNQVNQYGPGGSSVFSPTGTSTNVGGYNIPQFQQQVTLSPQAQQQYDQQQALGNQLTQLAGWNVNQVADAQSQAFDTSGLPQLNTSVNAGSPVGAPQGGYGSVQGSLGSWGGALGGPQGYGSNFNGFNQGPSFGGVQTGNYFGGPSSGGMFGSPMSSSANTWANPGGSSLGAQQFQFSPLAQGQAQRAVPGQMPAIGGPQNFGGIPQGFLGLADRTNLNGGDNFSASGDQVEQATFDRASALLQPGFDRQLGAANIAMSERGLPLGSESGNALISPILQEQNRTMQNASFEAVLAGRQEQERLAQQTMQREGQVFGQGMQGAQFGQSEAQRMYQNQMQNQQFGSSEAQRYYQNQMQNQQFGSQEAARMFGQQLSGAQFGQSEMDRMFGQNMAQSQFGQSEAQRMFGQQMMGGQFANQAQQQQYNQMMGLQAAQNQAQQQSYAQAMQNAQFGNTARQTAFQEMAYQRGLPINEIAALLGTAPGVQMPQFQQQPAFGINAADAIGATLGAQQSNVQMATAQQQAASAQMAAMYGLAGDIGSAGIGQGWFGG